MKLLPKPRIFKVGEGFCANPNQIMESRAVAAISRQGFRLEIKSEGVCIEAADDAGLFYAHQVLQQLVNQRADGALLCCQIEDWPDFEHRGYMLDISRDRVPTMAHLFHLVDTLAGLRYNQLQLYTEHTFAYKAHEQVWRDASPISAAEIRELDVYCRDRHIELVPNQNSFGHMERWLQHKAYKHLAECPDGFEHPISGEWRPQGSVLKPDDQSFEFVDGLYSELLPNFSSTKFNIGGDEPWELGKGASLSRVEAEGKYAVYLDFLSRICHLAESHGKQPMCWSDVLLEDTASIERLPKSITPVIWGYEADHPFTQQCERLAQLKHPFYVAPGDSTWNSYTGRHQNMVANVKSAATVGFHYGASGLLMTHWGDGGHQQSWPVSLPGMIWAGLQSWNTAFIERDMVAILSRLLGEAMTTVLIESADIDRLLDVKLMNRSFLMHSMSLDDTALTNFIPQPETARLQSLIKRCDTWIDQLKQDQSDQAMTSELSLMIRMSRFAAYRVLDDLANCPDAAKEIVYQYRMCWMARSRLGGLRDSLAHISCLSAG